MRATGVIGILLVVGAVVFSSGVEAANEQWKYLGANEKGERFFYDSANVLFFSKDLVQVWVKELSREPATKLVEVNCTYKLVRERQIISEAQKKAPIPPPRLPSKWRPMELDPAMKELHKMLCR